MYHCNFLSIIIFIKQWIKELLIDFFYNTISYSYTINTTRNNTASISSTFVPRSNSRGCPFSIIFMVCSPSSGRYCRGIKNARPPETKLRDERKAFCPWFHPDWCSLPLYRAPRGSIGRWSSPRPLPARSQPMAHLSEDSLRGYSSSSFQAGSVYRQLAKKSSGKSRAGPLYAPAVCACALSCVVYSS